MGTKPILIEVPETIETPRLILQMPKAGYGKEVHEAILDGYEDNIKWLNWSPTPPTPEAVEIDCRKHHADFILRDCIRYIIIEKATKRVLGRSSFAPLQSNWSIPQFGLAYFIRKSARTQGYATEAAHALAVLAFRVLKAQKVEIQSDSENIRSQKVAQRLGFSLECTKKGDWPRPDKQLADLQIYALFSEKDLPDWEVKW